MVKNKSYINKMRLIPLFLFALIFLETGYCAAQNQPVREYRVLAVRVDFPYEEPDHDTTTGRGKFDLRDYYTDQKVQDEYAHPWDIPPHNKKYFENHLEALKNYWETVSEGRTNIVYEVWPKDENSAYTMSQVFWRYGNGRTREQTNQKLAGLVKEALETCKNIEGSKIDFSEYDTFIIFHPGVGRETSDGINDIPSAYLTNEDILKYIPAPLKIDGKSIDNGIIVSEMSSTNGIAGLNGIMAQMFGFRLGLPSFSNNKDGVPAAGGWCLMDTGAMAWGYNTLAFIPTHPDAWSKIKLGWVEPVNVVTDTTLDIAATSIDNDLPRAIKIPINEDEYLLIENRFNYAPRDSLPEGIVFSDSDTSGVWLKVPHYDAYIPGKGVLIWHVNDKIISNNSADNSVNNDPYRRGLDLLEADGRQDIGVIFGFGDPRAEYVNGHEEDTFKSNGNDTLSPVSKPNSGSMWGATTGINVKVLSEPAEVMKISITFTNRVKGYPLIVAGADDIVAVDLNNDKINEILVSGQKRYSLVTDGNVHNIDSSVRPSISYSVADDEPCLFGIKDKQIVNFFFRNSAIDVEEIYSFGTISENLEFYGGSIFSGLKNNGKNIFFYRELNSSGSPVNSFIGIFNPETSLMESKSLNDTVQVISSASAENYLSLLCSDNTLRLFDLDDNKVSSYNLSGSGWNGPIMADIDRDNKYETVISGNGRIEIYRHEGNSESFPIEGTPVGSPAAADLDGDGYPEIIQCAEKMVFAYKAGGVLAENFPLRLIPGDISEKITSSPVIADLNNDGITDIAFATTNYRIVSLNIKGIETIGFPVSVRGIVNSSPCLFKSSSTGETAIAGVTTGNEIAAYDLKKILDIDKAPWAMSHGGPEYSSALMSEKIKAPKIETAAFKAFCYPNPITGNTGTFRITPIGTTDCKIILYTADGRQVFEKYVSAQDIIPAIPNEIRMDASELSNGLYIAKIQTKQKTIMYKIGVLK